MSIDPHFFSINPNCIIDAFHHDGSAMEDGYLSDNCVWEENNYSYFIDWLNECALKRVKEDPTLIIDDYYGDCEKKYASFKRKRCKRFS